MNGDVCGAVNDATHAVAIIEKSLPSDDVSSSSSYDEQRQRKQAPDVSSLLEIAVGLHLLGQDHSVSHCYDRAYEACAAALSLRERHLGERHPSVARTFFTIGTAHCQ